MDVPSTRVSPCVIERRRDADHPLLAPARDDAALVDDSKATVAGNPVGGDLNLLEPLAAQSLHRIAPELCNLHVESLAAESPPTRAAAA